MNPTPAETAYRELYRSRRVEEEIARLYPTDKIKSPIHLSIGQEAVSVAVCQALRPSDVVFGTYRSHALYLAKGGDLRRMIAELYGKMTGCAKGKAGSMHLIDVAAGMMGTSAVVATTIPEAVGYSLALEMQGRSELVACFLGDGAVEEGAFHESLTFAAGRKLPLLFVCENNFYAIHSTQAFRHPWASIADFAAGYGIRTQRFAQLDYWELHRAAAREIERLRSERRGPAFLECCCYRWLEHVGPNEDYTAGYRLRDEAQPWIDSDPLRVVGESLPAGVRERVNREVAAEIADAFAFAEASPFPPGEELYTDLFK